MKHNNQHTTKKSYAKPVIEEVALDYEMSLVMASPDQPIIEPPEGEAPVFPANQNTQIFKSQESPFGGSRPVY